LIGHSFGATVALRLACDRPMLVRRLTLIEPVFFAVSQGTAAWAAHQQAFAPFVAAWGAQDLVAATRAFHALWGEGNWSDLPEAVQQGLVRRIPLVPAGAPAIEDDNAHLLRDGRMARIGCPVSLIRGGNSPPVIAAIHAGLCNHMPQARDHVIAGAGHMVALTHAPDVARIIGA
jgi:pimeloyl-ACP methyl ester carboxylesterase